LKVLGGKKKGEELKKGRAVPERGRRKQEKKERRLKSWS